MSALSPFSSLRTPMRQHFALALLALSSSESPQIQPHAGHAALPGRQRDAHRLRLRRRPLARAARGRRRRRRSRARRAPRRFPRFSPDGKTIAFVGNYDGNRDLYTIAVAGGVPDARHAPSRGARRSATGRPTGALLFFTNGLAGRDRQVAALHASPPQGGLPEQAARALRRASARSRPTARWLAYTPHTTDTRTWKRYRGGMATDIWLFNLKDRQRAAHHRLGGHRHAADVARRTSSTTSPTTGPSTG